MTHRGTLAKPCMAGLLCLLLAACGEPTFRPLAQGRPCSPSGTV